MSYQEILKPYREEVAERYPLVMERVELMSTEETAALPYRDFFCQAALFLQELRKEEAEITEGRAEKRTQEEWQSIKDAGRRVWKDVQCPLCGYPFFDNLCVSRKNL